MSQQVFNILFAFASWTVTSFLCHWTAKRFLKTWDAVLESDSVLPASVVTLVQCLTCFVLVDVDRSANTTCIVKIIAHVLATFCTNYSMTFMNAASTFTIKLLEPITSALAQSIFQQIPIPTPTLISLPIMIYGALLFTGSPLSDVKLSSGTTLAFLSNVILAARNVAISKEHTANINSQLRGRKTIGVYLVTIVLAVIEARYTESRGITFQKFSVLVAIVIGSGIFHVMYSYISTNIVLRTMTVVNHSILNICKRLLVVLLLYSVGSRKASLTSWLGLVICALGLVIHALGKYVTSEKASDFFVTVAKGRTWKLMYILLPMTLLGVTMVNINNNNLMRIRTSFESIDVLPKLKFGAYDEFSPLLKTNVEIIQEAQRVHEDLFTKLLKPYPNVMLFDIALHENKGDPAITIGEMTLIKRLNKKLVYYCDYHVCKNSNLTDAATMVEKYKLTPQNLIILLHGGGNIVGWTVADHLRKTIFEKFAGFKFILFPQSIFMYGPEKHLRFCEDLYSNQDNFTMILRDRNSLKLAKEHFSGKPRFLLAPDIAFQIGPVQRFLKPFYDILWIRRTDRERVDEKIPPLPRDLTIHIADWLSWGTPFTRNHMERAYLIANNGMIFVQRGKVVITDRLHGHILSILLDIPHVIINNRWNKVSNYHNTWTKGLGNTRVADNTSHAIVLARQLLEEYSSVLPQKVPFMDVKDVL